MLWIKKRITIAGAKLKVFVKKATMAMNTIAVIARMLNTIAKAYVVS